MAATKKAKKPARKARTIAVVEDAPKGKEPKASKPDKKLSALDAAARVLSETKKPMTTREMIEELTTKSYWSSPGGKTPHATLYPEMLLR